MMAEIKLTPAETLSKEPKRWIATLIIVFIAVILTAWSGSALESNSTGGSGLAVAKGIILGILHPTSSILFTLQTNGVPYLLLETMCIAFLGTLVGAAISIPFGVWSDVHHGHRSRCICRSPDDVGLFDRDAFEDVHRNDRGSG